MHWNPWYVIVWRLLWCPLMLFFRCGFVVCVLATSGADMACEAWRDTR